jgi:hypothetical protein
MQTNNLQYAPTKEKPVVHVSQYDVGRQFQFKLYDGTTAFSMPSGTTARIDGIKPDNHGFSYTDKISVSGNTATVTTTEQMTVLAGTVECEIRFINGGNNIGTLNFLMVVEESPINAETDVSETEIPAIIDVATANMLDAEAWARGTKDGVAVGSDAEQYHNNSKYYSELAAQSEQNAANSEANASLSAASALASADNAHDSELAAAASADDAATSEDNAATSAQAAKLSEQNAKASEEILDYYVDFVIPRFVIVNNRLYIKNNAIGEFIVANNRLYIKNAS